mgnify:CR=1 FL=1
MNLAYRDVRHHLGRFLLTCVGLGLLLGVVLAMIGIYRGIVVEALTIVLAVALYALAAAAWTYLVCPCHVARVT